MEFKVGDRVVLTLEAIQKAKLDVLENPEDYADLYVNMVKYRDHGFVSSAFDNKVYVSYPSSIGPVFWVSSDNLEHVDFIENTVEEEVEIPSLSFDQAAEDILNWESTSSRNKYMRQIKPNVWIDVYDVLSAFEVIDPCLQHLLKKALAAGRRGHKDRLEDLKDIEASIKRAIEMHIEKESFHVSE